MTETTRDVAELLTDEFHEAMAWAVEQRWKVAKGEIEGPMIYRPKAAEFAERAADLLRSEGQEPERCRHCNGVESEHHAGYHLCPGHPGGTPSDSPEREPPIHAPEWALVNRMWQAGLLHSRDDDSSVRAFSLVREWLTDYEYHNPDSP